MSIEINNIKKTYKLNGTDNLVLNNVNLNIIQGEFVCILGPSGCGKSTLLNLIAGLEKPTDGNVIVFGNQVKIPGPDRAVMFQDAALFPWIKVIDNVEFYLKMSNIPKKERENIALHYLKKTHLTAFQNSYVHELSGGMKQRVALARCLAMNSPVLLMDEPFGALDSQTKEILQIELEKIWLDTKKTIIMVTHSVEEAVLLADRVVLMSVNPGGIKEVFEVTETRPRRISNKSILSIMDSIHKSLKEEVEKVAKREFDSDWHLE